MKQRKKRPVPPAAPVVLESGKQETEKTEEMPDKSAMYDSRDPMYLERHALAQELQLQSAQEGFVLLKNSGILPLTGAVRLNVFGRHGSLLFPETLCRQYGIVYNTELMEYYTQYQNQDPGYTGAGYDEAAGEYVPQNRTATGMFGNVGFLDQEPLIGHNVYNQDGSVRVAQIPPELLERAKTFSDTAVVVIYRHGGEGADHEKGDERLSEGEAAMLSFCQANFQKVVVLLATNNVIDGDFLAEDTVQKFYCYTYGGGVYSNNIGREVLADYESRVVLKYLNAAGEPEPHVYPIQADKLGAAIYTCNNPGDRGAEALIRLLLGLENPSGRLMDEILLDYDDDPVSRCFGGLTFCRESIGNDLYIYGHNYVAYKEGVYLGYKYFETFCPERVAYPFGFGLSYTKFSWDVGALHSESNQYGELAFSCTVSVSNIGNVAGKDVVQLYVTAPYRENSPYHLEKPLVALAAFEKTRQLCPGETAQVTLRWNARDISCYSDTAQCYVLEHGAYKFCVAANANCAHSDPAAMLTWELGEDIRFQKDEVTGTPYRNLFTGNEEEGYRYDARGTEQEHIVYLHRTDVNGVPSVAEGTFPETEILDAHTRETTQVLDLEKRKLASCYEMDSTQSNFAPEDIPKPVTNAVYRDEKGAQRNFMLQDVYRFIKNQSSPEYHNLAALQEKTGILADAWTVETDQRVWDHFLNQLSVNEMLCRFYHSGFEIPALKEYGIPVAYSADTPGQIGANNKLPMARTTKYCDTILACTFNKDLCYRLGLALAREAAASGEAGTSFFYAPGSNLHRSCLSGKNNNYFSQDAYLSGWICGHFLKGLQEGGVNGCLKHFACNDQEVSREGLVVFANEQTLRENYFAAFEHALKIGNGKGIMTSLGRVGTVNACGNRHLTVDLLRKEWGFDGMVITDGYGVTSYMYEINVMLGGHSGLLCFGNSGNFGECRDFMELYRCYLQYPGRTTTALRSFMQGSLNALMESHTFRELYADYDYYAGADANTTTDIDWFDGQIGVGYAYHQPEKLTYLGIKLQPREKNPPSMMPNTNCKDRGGTIRLDDYWLEEQQLMAVPGDTIRVPVAMEKCYGMQKMGFSICFDTDALEFDGIDRLGSVLPEQYRDTAEETSCGANVILETEGNLFDNPCGTLFHLRLKVKENAVPGIYPLSLLPLIGEGEASPESFVDKQGHAMSVSLVSQRDKYRTSGGWSGVYQSVDDAQWQTELEANETELADLTLLSGTIRIQ